MQDELSGFNRIKGKFPAACSVSMITKGIWLSIPRLLAARFFILSQETI